MSVESQLEEITALLRSISASVAVLEAKATQKRRKRPTKGKTDAALIEQGRAESANQEAIACVVKQWIAMLPDNPKPVLNDNFRLQILSFWGRCGESIDGVQDVFATIAGNPYWTGKTQHNRRVSLKEVVDHPESFIEGYAR